MKKILFFNMLLMFFFSYVSLAQEQDVETEEEEQWEPMVPKTDIFDKKIVEEKKPIEYAEIKEEDVLWSQFIWRIVDCREKLNFHIYYPTEDILNKKSLAQALIDGVRSGKVQAYGDENFTTKVTLTKVMERLGAADREIEEESMDAPGEMIKRTQKGFVNWRLVREFKIKEKWFFDKKHSKLDVRIIAICPVKVFKKGPSGNDVEATGNDTDLVREELFWVYFPEARRVLANTTCHTGKNQQANISFDDVFFKRYFSSRIVQAANVNDLTISEYTRGGLEAILESERIKYEMLKLESDFWSY
ncbi:MAG: gliding motility protein GldN [Prevotellaceae bacterium]|jgi:gliding motility associated protien GldN|nr:gliding motility protein GldN [Prevotellaceae bacterium]